MKESWLIEILLPLRDNGGTPFPLTLYTDIRKVLTKKFGGLTTFTRAPAKGFWQPGIGDEVSMDDIVIFELMTETLDREWWQSYRQKLEALFRQEELVVRAHRIDRI